MDNGGSFNKRFKIAVERNFDASVNSYESFEARHGLFGKMAERLAGLARVDRPAPRILDVGCGSGISTLVLSRIHGDASAIVGLDISDAMVRRARERLKDRANVRIERGDAEELARDLRGPFDAIYYNASIFLIPEYRRSVLQAAGLLAPAGCLFISFYEGFFDSAGRDAIRAAAGNSYRYGVVPKDEIKECLGSLGDCEVTFQDVAVEAGAAFAFDFLSIPAQSAGLFPKIPYEQRLPKISELCLRMEKESGPVAMRWLLGAARMGRAG